MTVFTKNCTEYRFYIDAATNQMRVEGTPIELVVTDLQDLEIGKQLVIKGYIINPITKAPRASLGKFCVRTSTISKIQP